jgi:dienelactone hydrolase
MRPFWASRVAVALALSFPVVCPASAVAAPPDEAVAADGSRVRIALGGGKPMRVPICGGRRAARLVHAGDRLRFAAAARGRGTTLTVRVGRCGAGLRGRRTLRRGRSKRGRTRLAGAFRASRIGDFRVTAELRRDGRVLLRQSRYARVTPARARADQVREIPLSFTVRNVNRSRLACDSDGGTLTVVGRLVAPRSLLGRRDPPVTLYLHEYGWGRFFWSFPRAGHDYARAMAMHGHASVVVDRLGYDESTHPAGSGTCLGSQADVAHQLVGALREGSYRATGARPYRFARVAVGGHSAGGAIAEIAAHSFGGIDALVLFAYADSGFTNRSVQEASEQGLTCTTGGEAAEPGGPGGYAFFAQTPDEWKSFMFTSAEQAVADQAAAMRNRDPCGDATSLTPAVISNNLNVPRIEAPVLLLYGTSDAIYEQPAAGEQQRRLFSGSKDVTLRFFGGTGHALTLERSAPSVRQTASEWLRARGF